LAAFVLGIVSVSLSGCGGDIDTVREIQAQRQVRLQAESQQDHLGEAFNLLNRLVELNPEKARRQISYHLNRWSETRTLPDVELSPLLRTVSTVLPAEVAEDRIGGLRFQAADINHLRDAYVSRRIVEWADHPRSDDPLLRSWMEAEQNALPEAEALKLQTAARLFDWTLRNVAHEPLEPTDAAPPPFEMPMGMTFRGAGYRQTDFNTMWRGRGDWLQRAGVFTLLCRQASIPAFVLAIPSQETGELKPWCVGTMVGQQVYLFDFELGTFIPGPGQEGIATLQEARSDESVLRRLTVQGFFDYPLQMSDVQQVVALLNVVPEAISPRMQLLQSGLVGQRRMEVYVDVDALAKRIDDVSGIAGVRLWDIPILAEVYEQELKKATERDPLLLFWYMNRYAVLDATEGTLGVGRWRHLHGQFDTDEEENIEGARTLYLAQRAPEFEIEDLRIDVDLQKAYAVRRQLGTDAEEYDLQIQQTQRMMRLAKRTATYWISLIQYDDQRYDTAESWFRKRVLTDDQQSFWEPAARYNLARSVERLGEIERAIELYKTDGDPQEHGNRIRARLLSQQHDL